ncbi:MAG: methyl-accepting chemotaxis protein [Verrucomicrobiota bacterium]
MFPKIGLGFKITFAAVLVTIAMGIFSVVVQSYLIAEQGQSEIQNAMRYIIKEAENVREATASLNQNNAFHTERLLEELKTKSDYKNSTIYKTVPVVAAWEAIKPLARDEGFEFRVPSMDSRNEKNTPTTQERQILEYFETTGAAEYFNVDRTTKKIIYARPIKLTEGCLSCHGNPANSLTGDGKDILGFRMENWKAGRNHGAFILTASTDRIDSIIWSGAKRIALLSLLSAAGIGIVFSYINRKLIVLPLNNVISNVNESTIQTTLASNEISKSSNTIAESASRQAAALEETSASLEELTSMTHTNSENAGLAKTLAEGASTKASSGAVEMQEMIEAMQSIKTASDDIAKIMKSINEIAFQTNILALNASVEAARAGAAGAGFAVVADEVRNLAQRSALAAEETSAKIAESIQRSNRGVDISSRVVKTFQEIVEQIKKVDQTVSQIASASEEQRIGIDQINSAVSQLDKSTQSNAAGSEELAASAQELCAQAASLQDSVQSLAEMMGIQVAQAALKVTTSTPSSLRSTPSQPRRLN